MRAAIDPGVDAVLGELALELIGDAPDAVARLRIEPRQPRDDRIARFGIEFAEGQIFQLLAHTLHADAARQRRIDVDRLLRDAPALLRLLDEVQRAHVVQAVGELHQQHADVVRHREHQLAEILRLLGALGEKFELGEFGDAVDQAWRSPRRNSA